MINKFTGKTFTQTSLLRIAALSVAISLFFYCIGHVSPIHLNLFILFCIGAFYLLILRRYTGYWDISDARVWFIFFFLLYGIIEPLVRTKTSGIEDEIIMRAIVLYWLGAVGILVSLILRKEPRKLKVFPDSKQHLIHFLKNISIASFLLGLCFLYLNYSKLPGGLNAIFEMRRGLRKDYLYQGIVWPHDIIFTISLNIHFYCILHDPNQKSRSAPVAFILTTSIVLVYWIIAGERDQIIMLLLSFIAILSSKRKLELTFRRILIVFIVTMGLFFLGHVRSYLPRSIANKNANDLVTSVKGFGSLEALKVRLGTFGNTYLPTVTYLMYQEKELRYGSTYLQAIQNIVPRKFYPGERPIDIGKEFAESYNSFWAPGHYRIMGFGFSPVIEAYINFGWIGPPLVFFLIGIILNKIVNLRQGKVYSILLYATLIPHTLTLNNSSFAAALTQAVRSWLLLTVCYEFAFLLAKHNKKYLQKAGSYVYPQRLKT